MEEARDRAIASLTSGLGQGGKAEAQLMASYPLPLSQKYRHLMVETMLKENVSGSSRDQVST